MVLSPTNDCVIVGQRFCIVASQTNENRKRQREEAHARDGTHILIGSSKRQQESLAPDTGRKLSQIAMSGARASFLVLMAVPLAIHSRADSREAVVVWNWQDTYDHFRIEWGVFIPFERVAVATVITYGMLCFWLGWKLRAFLSSSAAFDGPQPVRFWKTPSAESRLHVSPKCKGLNGFASSPVLVCKRCKPKDLVLL